jgi:hypothetical protein
LRAFKEAIAFARITYRVAGLPHAPKEAYTNQTLVGDGFFFFAPREPPDKGKET